MRLMASDVSEFSMAVTNRIKKKKKTWMKYSICFLYNALLQKNKNTKLLKL